MVKDVRIISEVVRDGAEIVTGDKLAEVRIEYPIQDIRETKFQDVFKVGEVGMTHNYKQFKHIKGNRYINHVNLRKLIASMKEEQLKVPVIINELGQVVDGAHRVMACEELGLPVYFIVIHGYRIEQVIRANTTNAVWTRRDFLNTCIGQGKEEYKKFEEIRGRYGVTINDLIKVFAQVQGTPYAQAGRDFEQGKFQCNGEGLVLQFLDALQDFEFFPESHKTAFIQAFARVYAREGYDHERMKKKIATREHVFKKMLSIDEYIALLCNQVYSYGANRDGIYYSVDSKRFHY